MITINDGVNVLIFGSGDIEVTSGGVDDPEVNHGVVAFGQGEKGAVGRDMEIYGEFGCNPKSVDFPHHTRFVFTDPRSIDVVISHLEKVKKGMIEDPTL